MKRALAERSLDPTVARMPNQATLVAPFQGDRVDGYTSSPTPRTQEKAFHVKRRAVAYDPASALSRLKSKNLFLLSCVGDR